MVEKEKSYFFHDSLRKAAYFFSKAFSEDLVVFP